MYFIIIQSVLNNANIKQNLDDAKKFFEKKNSFLKDNLNKLQKSIISRQDQNKCNIFDILF